MAEECIIAPSRKSRVLCLKAAGITDGPGAVVGLSKLAKMVAQVFGRKTHYFDTIDEAKEWLVSESKKSR